MKRHEYKEAFCLMQYGDVSDPNSEVEWIWNSRDGVSPFIVSSKDGEKRLQHFNWSDDIYAPQYVPNVGQRAFVSLTLERGKQLVQLRVDQHWEATAHSEFAGSFTTKEEMFDSLMSSLKEEIENGAPSIVVCTKEMQRQFIEEREERRRTMTKARFA